MEKDGRTIIAIETTMNNPDKHHRRSIRLKGYDYSQTGLYFITICTHNRAYLFGDVANGEMIANDAGRMIADEWLKLPDRFKNLVLHQYAVMPNHFHAIMEIAGIATANKTIGDMIGAFESISTVEYIRGVKTNDWQPFDRKLWQRNYWEHIIRDEMSYFKISEYITTNPANWDNDTLKN